jgi:hypothetical protein
LFRDANVVMSAGAGGAPTPMTSGQYRNRTPS